MMFRNYFVIALRNLYKNKLYSLINIFGLSIGLACSILILMYVANELSYDQFHEESSRIYRINERILDKSGSVVENSAAVPWSVGPTLQNEFPDLGVTRMYQAWQKDPLISNEQKNKSFYEENVFFVDTTFFDTFSFDVIIGNQETALSRPQSVVLTESAAKKYFGHLEVLGKTLLLEDKLPLIVTAVTSNVPANSHFHYDFLIPLLNIGDIFNATGNNWHWEGWYWNPVHTYLVLPERYDEDYFENYFDKFVKDHFPVFIKELATLSLQPLTEIHFNTSLYQEIEPTRSKSSIYIAGAIAIFILLIATINFVNLSTATASKRAKEVGIRKVLGSNRRDLIYQFYGESLLLCFVSLMLSVILIYYLISPFEQVIMTQLNMSYLLNPTSIGITLLGTLLLGLVAGTYPALILSSFQPAKVLKSSKATGKGGINLLRKGLVVFQFIISIVLLFSAFVVYHQHNYLTTKELGFAKEQIIMFSIRGTTIKDRLETFKTALKENPQVIAATATSDIVGQDVPVRPFELQGYDDIQNIPGLFTDHDFLQTFDVELIAGRDFDKHTQNDRNNFLINEAMINRLKDKDWLGQKVGWERGDSRIIGMVDNFNFMSLKTYVRPLFIGFADGFLGYMAVRVKEGDIPGTISALEQTWKNFEPYRTFAPFFLDEKLNQLYQDEQNTAKLVSYFSILAIIIAFLGLVGLVTYRVNTRIQEIGIRKVLGASQSGLIGLLSKEFIILILVANAVALPGAWYIMRDWLQNFAYRIIIPWWLFIASGSIVLIIALVTSFIRSYLAAQTNPVNIIKEQS